MYFTVMLNFYTFTYIQLVAQIILLAYTFFSFSRINDCKLKRSEAKQFISYILWYGLFTAFCFLSNKWAIYPAREDANTLLGIFRIFVIGLCIVYDIKDKYSFYKLIKIFVYSGVIFAILTILSNPISDWGEVSFESFGNGFIRNGVANICVYLICFIVLFWRQLFSRQLRNVMIILFTVTILLCGSRRAIVLMAIISLLSVLFTANIRKRINYLIIGCLLVLAILFIAYNVPIIKSLYLDRIIEMIFGTESTDASTIGRSAYIIIGIDMIKEHPWFGWGTDAFYNYLLRNPYAYASNMSLRAVYSHNNYIEIGTSYGIIGLILFYSMHVINIFKTWRNRKFNIFSKAVVIILITTMIGNYGGIDFNSHISMYILIMVQCMASLAEEDDKESSYLGDYL